MVLNGITILFRWAILNKSSGSKVPSICKCNSAFGRFWIKFSIIFNFYKNKFTLKKCIFEKILLMQKIFIIVGVLLIGILFIKCKSKVKKSLDVGDTIPEFQLLTQEGANFNSSDIVGKQAIVIYFYPKDDTPGCTKEACKFRDEFEVFSDLNATVIGISSDDVASHKAFAEKYNLPFILLADTDKKVRNLFGVPSFGAGLIPGRVTYIVDKKGVLQYVFNNMSEPEKHIEKSLEILKSLD